MGRQGRIDTDRLGVRFSVHQAREPVHPVTADAGAGVDGFAVLVLVEQNAQGKMRGVQAQPLQVMVELLDAGLVLDGRVGELATARPIGGILAGRTVHVVEAFGLGVVRLKLLVRERPGRREATVVLDYTEVLRSQTEQGGAVQFGVASDVVVLFGREFVAVLVVPLLAAVVLGPHEHRVRVPVVPLPGQEGPALQQQNPLS